MRSIFTFLFFIFIIPNSVWAQSVIAWLKNSPDHTIFSSMVVNSGLEAELQGQQELTLFAPSDQAFSLMPDSVLNYYLNDPDKLKHLVKYHFVSNAMDYSEVYIYVSSYIVMMNSVTTTITQPGGKLKINQAAIEVANIQAANGFIYPLDEVLIAPEYTVLEAVGSSPNHTMLDSFLRKSLYQTVLMGYGPFTIFAPTNDAFQWLTSEGIHDINKEEGWLNLITGNHIAKSFITSDLLTDGEKITMLSGEKLTVTKSGDTLKLNNANLVVRDILTDNGVVHVIDVVQIPSRNVMDVLYSNSDLDFFANMIYSNFSPRELELQILGDFTVFAFNNEALDHISPDLYNFINSGNQNRLNIIDYHILKSKVLTSEMSDGQSLLTYNNKLLYVYKSSDSIKINNSKIIVGDLKAKNGVVHKIDRVLDLVSSTYNYIPNKLKIFPNPAADMISITNHELPDGVTYYIIDMENRVVKQGNLFNNQGIHIQELCPGSYQLCILSGQKVYAQLFTKI